MGYKSDILILKMEHVKNRTLLTAKHSFSQMELSPLIDVFLKVSSLVVY